MGQINSKTGTQMPSTSGVDDDVISETGIEYAYYSLYYDSALVDSSEKDFDGLSVSVIGYGNNLKLRIVNNGEEICVDLFCANLLLSIKESRDDCGKTTDCKVVFGDIEMEFSICVEEAC